MGRKYAKGKFARGECARSGIEMPLSKMTFDGEYPNLRVHPRWREPDHPQEKLVSVDDPIALWRPAPLLSEERAKVSVPALVESAQDGSQGFGASSSGVPMGDPLPTFGLLFALGEVTVTAN